MNLSDLDIKRSYITFGEDSIAQALVSPGLMCAVQYDRSVGFFSSNVLLTILKMILKLLMRAILSVRQYWSTDLQISSRKRFKSLMIYPSSCSMNWLRKVLLISESPLPVPLATIMIKWVYCAIVAEMR